MCGPVERDRTFPLVSAIFRYRFGAYSPSSRAAALQPARLRRCWAPRRRSTIPANGVGRSAAACIPFARLTPANRRLSVTHLCHRAGIKDGDDTAHHDPENMGVARNPNGRERRDLWTLSMQVCISVALLTASFSLR